MTWPEGGSDSAPCLLGLDVGTTTVRALLFDPQGRVLSEAACEPKVIYPRPGWAEIDVEERWGCSVRVIRCAVERSGLPPESIAAIGLTGLMHALTPLDAQGRILAPAMLWMDQRCRDQAQRMGRDHGDLLARILGHSRVSTTSSAPKLLWLNERDPDLMARTARFLPVQSFVALRLTGLTATDPSNAGGTALYDRMQGDWSDELLSLVGVSRAKLPPIVPPTTILGGLTRQAADLTGLPSGTPVIVGASDVHCTRLGADAVGNNRACLYLGTAAWIAAPRQGGGGFGASATTGAALRWLAGLLGVAAEGTSGAYANLAGLAESVPPGARGLLFLPHLMGERGPRPDPLAKGALFGLSLAHGQADVARAVLEGTAYHLRAILEQQVGPPAPDELVAVGGCAKSVLWRELIADITGVPLRWPQVLEAGALGASLLAAVALGLYPDEATASRTMVRWAERIAPNPALRPTYDAMYALYSELEQRVAPLYPRLPIDLEEAP